MAVELTKDYDRNEWLAIREAFQSGHIVNSDYKPYSYNHVRYLIYRQYNGGDVFFTCPDGSEALGVLRGKGDWKRICIRRSAVESFIPYETYQTYITDDMQDEERLEIIERLKNGESANQLSFEYGVSQATVYRLKEKLGV